jgi:hypothetical protein
MSISVEGIWTWAVSGTSGKNSSPVGTRVAWLSSYSRRRFGSMGPLFATDGPHGVIDFTCISAM